MPSAVANNNKGDYFNFVTIINVAQTLNGLF